MTVKHGSAETQVFGGPVRWSQGEVILEVAADRTLDSVLRRMHETHAEWVVVVRQHQDRDEVYYYAFRSGELVRLANQRPERAFWPIERAMDMHEWSSSPTARRGRPRGPLESRQGPAAARIVDFDAAGQIRAIGERLDLIPHAAAADRETRESAGDTGLDDGFPVDLGPMRGGGASTRGGAGGPPPAARTARGMPPSSPPAAEAREAAAPELDVTLSAEAPAEVKVGANARVPFQVELTSEAIPLAVSRRARARRDLPIVITLSAENDALEILRTRECTVDPPLAGQPRSGFFTIKGVRPGASRLAVSFHQGGSELGVIGLAVEVVQGAASKEKARGEAIAEPRDIADDDKLALIIDQRVEGGQVFYEYTLHSEALGLPYRRVRSKPLLDRGGGAAATAQAFVERIYERVTRELDLKRLADDLRGLQREARALGANLCQELFDPDVAALLWPLRNRITLIQIVSWEPFIPWELVRLRDPASGEIDERFLCEYGLVRTLSDVPPSRTLRMDRWAYLGAVFPSGSFPPIGAELNYFTTLSPESLRGHGITPEPIMATRDGFYDTLAKGDFDVLHISCHAMSLHNSIEHAKLIIGEEPQAGGTKPPLIEVNTVTVQAEARLSQRRPLVFLNGCETGRVGAVLTEWGGWPNVFLRTGAGAFVGSSWGVRDKPAAAFSTTFYNTLLGGKTLAEAASAARAAAKQLGDASWLAFKVYGHPRARRAQPVSTNGRGEDHEPD